MTKLTDIQLVTCVTKASFTGVTVEAIVVYGDNF